MIAREAQNTPRKAKPAAQGDAQTRPKRGARGKQPGSHHSGDHGQTVVATTARGGSHGQAVVIPTAVVVGFRPVVPFPFRVPLRLPAVFAIFFLYIAMYLDIQKRPPIHSIAISSPFS